jgi:C1A family cysteine protease
MTAPTSITPRRIHGLGWKPDLPDARDRVFDHKKVLRKLRQKLPAKVDLRSSGLLAPIYDQGNLGSCTANAIGKLYEYQQRKQGLTDYIPSRLFIYYGERELEGSIRSDDGAEIRDGLKVVNHLGAPHESLWPYNIGAFAERPAQPAYDDGQLHQALAYESVAVKTTAVKAALASGHPVVIGFTVYRSFYSIGADGFMPLPKAGEGVEGGHAVLMVGYARMKAPWDRYAKDYGIYQNSWAADWGAGGYFYAPLGWMCNTWNADDFWTITQAEG